MKIKKIRTQIKKIPLQTPFVTALRRVENVEFIRVCILLESGLSALGEAPATKAITGEDLESIEHSINQYKKDFLSKTVEEALNILHQLSIGSSAKAALDMALVSLQAQENAQELYEYLGAKQEEKIETDITISLNSKEDMLYDAKEAYANGFHILKVKFGSDIEHAIETSKALLVSVPKAKFLIDANQAWSVKQSLHYIDLIKSKKIELIEQPVKAKDLEGLKLITQKSDIPILADEAAFSLEDVKYIVENNIADMINIKLMKCGGITKAVEILKYAREKNVKCMLGSMLEGPNSIYAAECLAMAYKDVIQYVDLDSPHLYKQGFMV